MPSGCAGGGEVSSSVGAHSERTGLIVRETGSPCPQPGYVTSESTAHGQSSVPCLSVRRERWCTHPAMAHGTPERQAVLGAVCSSLTYGERRGCRDSQRLCASRSCSPLLLPHTWAMTQGSMRTSSCGTRSRWPVRISGIASGPCRVPVVVGHAPPPDLDGLGFSARVNPVFSRHARLTLVAVPRALAGLPACWRVSQTAGHAAC
jgi:hypothetical protein